MNFKLTLIQTPLLVPHQLHHQSLHAAPQVHQVHALAHHLIHVPQGDSV